MLRASIRSSRAFGYKPDAAGAGRQWHAVQVGRVASGVMRGYADNKKPSIAESKPIVLPGSQSSATSEPAPPGRIANFQNLSGAPTAAATPVTPSSAPIIPPQNMPLTPPTPEAVGASPPPPSTSPAAPAPKPRRILRKLLLTIFLLTTGGFAGGLYYSRINDNFHDFFTEYVPFGEEAVLYFEEREFRQRYPRIAGRGTPSRDNGDLVKIPSQSGVSWKLADEAKSNERYSNATEPKAPATSKASKGPSETTPKDSIKAVEDVKPSPPAPKKNTPPPAASSTEEPVAKENKKPQASSFTAPEVDQPSKFPPEVTRIDPINIKDANEPLVQDLVKIMNDIISVVNADNSNKRFSATIGKAKEELNKFGSKINDLKSAAQKDADNKIQAEKSDFDRAAKELIRRLEGEMATQQSQWQDEYQTERQKIQNSYEDKLKSEIEQANEVNEQRLRNQLLEQAVEMKRQFTADLKSRVEEEREGRLGKLSDLTNTVNELEKLTGDWNSVVDSNLKTQHLHVAVEAVRANLEQNHVPRPFVRELAALKEIAGGDEVVNAAISSVNPTAYQKGIPSSAHLIDRFRRVATEVRKASLLPEDAGVASHASSYVLSKLLFKKKGLATGDDVESILTRTETYLEEGDLDRAAREMNGLKGWAKTLSKDWLGEVRKVLEVQQALEVISTEARLQSLRVE